MKNLRICDVGLAPDTSHAFHSMLNVVSGRSRAVWSLAEAATADVMIASCDGDPASLAAWRASGKPLVLVIDDRSSWPPAPFVLRHPFRVMQLLSILDDVAEQFQARPSAAMRDRAAWAAAESLRQCMPHATGADWQVARASDGRQVWIGRGHAHADADALAGLRECDMRVGAFESTGIPPPASAKAFALCDLAWFIGLGGDGDLAPWLARDSAYRLRRWPDFGRLGAGKGLLELCAHATTHAWAPAPLARATGQPLVDVHRFLNAASLAGLLASAQASVAGPPTPRPAAASGGWHRLLGGLRRRLGFAA